MGSSGECSIKTHSSRDPNENSQPRLWTFSCKWWATMVFTFKQLTPGDSPKLYNDLQWERKRENIIIFITLLLFNVPYQNWGRVKKQVCLTTSRRESLCLYFRKFHVKQCTEEWEYPVDYYIRSSLLTLILVSTFRLESFLEETNKSSSSQESYWCVKNYIVSLLPRE